MGKNITRESMINNNNTTSEKHQRRMHIFDILLIVFSAANLTLAGFTRTNALGESMPSRHLNMFNLRLCNAAIIRYSQLKFGHMHLVAWTISIFHHTVVSVIVLVVLPQ